MELLDLPFYAQEVLGVKLGDKMLAQADVSPERLPAAAAQAEAAGLVLGAQDDGRTVLLGRDAAALARWASADDRERGRLLGYPSCCIESYEEWARQPREDIVHCIARRSPAGPWPFLLNTVRLFHSRLFGKGEQAREDRERLQAEARGPRLSLCSVITWHPCSFACAASLEKAKRIWGALPSADASWLREALAKPVRFTDWNEFEVGGGPKSGARLLPFA